MHFLIAAPRSGTTWMQTAFNAHPEVFCTENRLFGEFCEIWPNMDGSQSPRLTLDVVAKVFAAHVPAMAAESQESRSRWIADALIDALVDMERRRSGKTVLVDKLTPYAGTSALVLERIGAHFPDANIIHLIRDGRDVLVSGYFHWISRSPEGRAQLENIDAVERLLTEDFIAQWVDHWREVNEVLAGHPQVTQVVRYEDLISDFHRAFMPMLRAVAVESDGPQVDVARKAASFERMSGGRRPGHPHPTGAVRQGLPGDWRNWMTRRDGELFDQIGGKLLRELGYADEQWLADLPESLQELRRAST